MRFTLCLVVLLVSSSAWARGGGVAVDQVHVIGSDTVPYVASWKGGLVLFGPDARVHRVYRYGALKGGAPDRLRVDDLNGDGQAEIIGVGKPTFGLSASGDPLWHLPDGCQGFATADVKVEERKDGQPRQELACLRGGVVQLMTHDGQSVWQMDYGRTRLSNLGLGDMDDDGYADLEFKARGYRGYWRISSEGEEIGTEFTERLTTVQNLSKAYAAEAADLIGGKTSFDLDGDGKEEERLEVAGGKVRVLSSSKGKPIAELDMPGGQVLSAAVGDGDGDGKAEIILGGLGHVLILAADGSVKASHEINPRKISRVAEGKLEGANASALEEEDAEKLQALFEEKFGSVKACYQKRLKAYSLTGRGKLILKFNVSKAGKITGQERLFAFAEDDALLKCISKASRRWKVPKAVEADGHVILDMSLGWKDSL